MIPVTKSYLPPIHEFQKKVDTIWADGWITNNGPLNKLLTEELISYLGVNQLDLVANGTLALQLAIKSLSLKGEIITTPFSYVATTTSIIWEGCEPVFVDVEDYSFCIDPDLIEQAITMKTSAILATHVYGYPCDVERIESIAKKYDIKVIYDAAHAFGVKYNGRSILTYGDISALSFHATKLFHTTEGGALVCSNPKVAEKVNLLKKFGHIGEDHYVSVGINAKMSELHAAMGLCVLPKVKEIISFRKDLSNDYVKNLKDLNIRRPVLREGVDYNYAYFPIVFESHSIMMKVRQKLIEDEVFPRRYFYPSLNKLPYVKPSSCPVSEALSDCVLCLPLYYGLEKSDVEKVCKIIRGVLT